MRIAVARSSSSTLVPYRKLVVTGTGIVVDLQRYKDTRAAHAARDKYRKEGRQAFVTLEEYEAHRAKEAL